MQLGEGPAWDERTNTLWWVDIDGRRVWRLRRGRPHSWQFDEPVAAVVHRECGGHVVVCRRRLLLTDDELRIEAEIPLPVAPDPTLRLNDAAADPAGRLWVGSMATDGTHGRGELYCVDRARRVRVAIRETSISNGLDWNQSQTIMYFVDTPTRRVDAYLYDAATGRLGARSTFTDVPVGLGKPDGLTVDAENCVWVALWGGGAVLRLSPGGELIDSLALPVRNVTSCAFGGPSMNRLYITTARRDTGPLGSHEEPHAGRVFVSVVPMAGRPARRYSG